MRLILPIFLLVLIVGCSDKDPRSSWRAYPYLGEWQQESRFEIAKALVQGGVRGCGVFKYKPSVKDSGEYLVYCSRDGTDWRSYIVWSGINKVIGPNPPQSKYESNRI